MDTKILDNDKSNVKDKSNFLKTDDIVAVERYNQLGKKSELFLEGMRKPSRLEDCAKKDGLLSFWK